MICPRCEVEMSSGIAIDPLSPRCCFTSRSETITADTMKLILVWKCHVCGYSDTGLDNSGVGEPVRYMRDDGTEVNADGVAL